jgi:2-polyprenyl-3-methyl-5-hydroxy-6-metoxy-1,4-benzoquinol methylase
MLKKMLFALRMYFILGKDRQTFLDAKWIRFLIKNTPQKYKKAVALKILALSPHYFIGEKKGTSSFLLSEYKRNLKSRQLLFKYLISDNISSDYSVIDYGCGPGFLAKIVAKSAKKVYGLDISDGVLLCADTINHRNNLNYLNVFKNQADAISDNSIDLIYSFAVLQHVSENLVDSIFDLFYSKLKASGKLLLQVQLADPKWKSEKEWIEDQSLTGKIKYEYGLHCFSNTADFYKEKLEKNKLKFISVENLSKVFPFEFDDTYKQQLIIAQK